MEFVGIFVKILKVKTHSVIRYFLKFDSINGRKLLTANLIFASGALISCLSRSCFVRVSFSLPSGGLSPKKAAVNHLCGVSLMLCLTMSCVAGSLKAPANGFNNCFNIHLILLNAVERFLNDVKWWDGQTVSTFHSTKLSEWSVVYRRTPTWTIFHWWLVLTSRSLF